MIVIEVAAGDLQLSVDAIDTANPWIVSYRMGVESEVEGAVVSRRHAAVPCCIVDCFGAFVETDELLKDALGVDPGDPQLVVFGISSAAEKECFVVRQPMIGVTIPKEGVVGLVKLIPPDGMFFKVVESGVEGDKGEDSSRGWGETKQGLVFGSIPELSGVVVLEIEQGVWVVCDQIVLVE